jgi:exopolysaccharide/PEP-CTERM locus tyrosine autokinase
MSLIESALQKLRRTGDAEAEPAVVPARNGVGPAPLQEAAAPPAPLPQEPISSKRITVDFNALRAAGYLPEPGLERRFADHYRQIKRPLIEKALKGSAEMRLIMVSSALPGDGKSFTSISLALSMAHERDVSVLLVDADAPRGHVSEIFGLRREQGLLDALRDESVEVESLIVHTDVRGFEILPAGKFAENATELLASARMTQVATRLAARNSRRLIVFDSAPLLVSTEARALTRIPGQVVIVVRAGVTPQQAMLDAVGHVDKSKLQGLILNDAPFRSGAGYYGYGYYGEDNTAAK